MGDDGVEKGLKMERQAMTLYSTTDVFARFMMKDAEAAPSGEQGRLMQQNLDTKIRLP
jgi:hypothetical protein